MEIAEKAKLYGALADPLRLRIVDLLLSKDEACGKEIAATLDMSVALVSHHTKILEDSGLLVRRKEGVYSRFSLNRSRLQALELGGPAPQPQLD